MNKVLFEVEGDCPRVTLEINKTKSYIIKIMHNVSKQKLILTIMI
jgi:hypothetical protein